MADIEILIDELIDELIERVVSNNRQQQSGKQRYETEAALDIVDGRSGPGAAAAHRPGPPPQGPRHSRPVPLPPGR